MNKRTLSSQPKNKSGGVKPTLEDPFLKPAPPNHKFQQAPLCWLKLNLKIKLFRHDETIDYIDAWSVLGKMFDGCAETFTRACETLARIRKLSRKTTALKFNIATSGGKQVNLTN